jgi:hypothetical protein
MEIGWLITEMVALSFVQLDQPLLRVNNGSNSVSSKTGGSMQMQTSNYI